MGKHAEAHTAMQDSSLTRLLLGLIIGQHGLSVFQGSTRNQDRLSYNCPRGMLTQPHSASTEDLCIA